MAEHNKYEVKDKDELIVHTPDGKSYTFEEYCKVVYGVDPKKEAELKE